MKILVFHHELVLGGTTVNCIELAAALRDRHGHEVALFATPGPMGKLVEDHRLRFIPAPFAPFHPSPARIRALRDVVRKERPDLVYVWETWPCLDTYFGVHLPMGIPMLVTDMQMHVTRVLPKDLITTFGTPELVDEARAAGRHMAELLLPPVDIQLNAPDAVDGATFRQQCGIAKDEILLVTVSRLVDSMKGESLDRSIDAVRSLGRHLPLRLLIVGDGTARARIGKLADEVNAELGRPAVLLVGALLDPRPAYAAADIVLGMGGSSLRAMAFAKPVIVTGERAFSAPFTPSTAEHFLYKGLFGQGDGSPGNERMIHDIQSLAQHPEQLPALGAFSRRFVEEHFSIDVIANRLADLCVRAMEAKPRYPVAAMDALRTSAVYLRERRFLWRGQAPIAMKAMDAIDAKSRLAEHS